MAITRVCKLVIIGRQLLQALDRNGTEISGKRSVFGQHNCAFCHEAVYQWLLAHGF